MRYLIEGLLCCAAFCGWPVGAEEEKAGVIPDWTWAQNVAENDAAMCYPAWIWRHDTPEKALGNRYFSRKIEIPAGVEPAAAWLRVTADNAYTLYVNGQEIGTDEWWQSVEYWDIKPYLHEGGNLIAVKAWDFGGACGLYLYGEIRGSNGETIAVKTDTSWDCTLNPAADWITTGSGADTQKAQVVQEGVAPDTTPVAWSAEQPERIVKLLLRHRAGGEASPFPCPQSWQPAGSPIALPWGVTTVTDTDDAVFAAGELQRVLKTLDPRFQPADGAPKIRLAIPEDRAAFPAQGYRIRIDAKLAEWRIEATDKAGFIYAVWSFLQLIHPDGDAYAITPGRMEDFPDVALRGIVDMQHSPEIIDWMSFYKLNAAKLYLNYTVPPPAYLKQMREYAENRGVHLIPSLHPPTLFSFQPGSEDMQMLLTRIDEIHRLGFRELCILQDDYPNETAGADRKTYGEGIDGLVLAQAYMMREIVTRFGSQFDRIIFMPRVYFDPQVMGPYPAVDGFPGHLAYRAKLGDYTLFPPEIEMYTTRGNPEYTAKLRGIIKRKSHVFQNYNEAALAGFQMHFEPYPVVPRRMIPDICGLWLNGADSPMPFAYWEVNYLTFSENTWNIDHPVGLAPAFAEQYGADNAELLCHYAELLGGHRNIIGTMEEFWWLPEQFATRMLNNEINLAEPTAEDLQRFTAKAARCREALQLILNSNLPDEVKDELGAHAVRLANIFEIKVAIEEVRTLIAQMESVAPDERRPLAERALTIIDTATAKARISQEIIRKMRLFYTAIVPDYSYVGYLQQLLKRDVEEALNSTNCVRNGNFEMMQTGREKRIAELPGWTIAPVKGGMVLRGDTPPMSGKNCLALRTDMFGNPESHGVIVSDPLTCTGGTLQWAQAAEKGGATTLTVRVLDAEGKPLATRDFTPESSRFALQQFDVSAFRGQTIRIEFSASTREKGMGWNTWLDAVSIR